MNVTDHHFMEGTDGLCSSGIGGGELCGRPRSEHLYQGERNVVPAKVCPGCETDGSASLMDVGGVCDHCGYKDAPSMDFDAWMRYGIEQGWCGPPVCSTHDGTPTTEAEEVEFFDGNDPCVHVVRLYEDAETKTAVETNHSPSVWRNHYRPKEFDTNPVAWRDDDPELREATEEMMKDMPPGASVMDIVTGKVIHYPGKWADNFNKKDS